MKTQWNMLIVILALGLGQIPAKAATEKAGVHYFDSGGVKIAYLEQGQGEPVILIHGALASSDINWVKPGIMAALARNYRTIALDLRGHGQSDKPYDPQAYGRALVEDVVRLMDHLKIARAHFLGYSLGSLVLFKLIVDHPQRIASASMGGAGMDQAGRRPESLWGVGPLSGRRDRYRPRAKIHDS